jgi:hypothetical protein
LPRDVGERVAPLVPVRGGIGQLAAADAVEDDEDDARKWSQVMDCWPRSSWGRNARWRWSQSRA